MKTWQVLTAEQGWGSECSPQTIDPQAQTSPLLKEKLLASAYRLRGAVSTWPACPLRTAAFRVQTPLVMTISEVVSERSLPDFRLRS